MPLFSHKHLSPEGEVGVWNIQEEGEWFLERLELFEEEKVAFDRIKGQGRRLEWLAARYLIHFMSKREDRGALYKDEFGKPHLENSKWGISISHSHNRAAAIAAPVSVGIDIQIFVPKIERLSHKYMREEEFDSLDAGTRLEHMHLYWCAKEALYKAYGRNLLDFRKNILVDPFPYNPNGGLFSAQIQKDDFLKTYQLQFEVLGDYFLVYTLPGNG